MAKINGQYVICDRCGADVFRKLIDSHEANWERFDDFEPLPDGWDLVAIPYRENALPGNAYNRYLQVCHECHELWDTLINENFLLGTPYYQPTEESNDTD